MNFSSIFDELLKLGAVSDEQAQSSLDRLETLEKNKPTVGQVARYGALGAVAGPVIGGVGNALEHGRVYRGKGNLLANVAKGAISSGAIPLVRGELDRRAEVGTLKKYVGEGQKTAGKVLQFSRKALEQSKRTRHNTDVLRHARLDEKAGKSLGSDPLKEFQKKLNSPKVYGGVALGGAAMGGLLGASRSSDYKAEAKKHPDKKFLQFAAKHPALVSAGIGAVAAPVGWGLGNFL